MKILNTDRAQGEDFFLQEGEFNKVYLDSILGGLEAKEKNGLYPIEIIDNAPLYRREDLRDIPKDIGVQAIATGRDGSRKERTFTSLPHVDFPTAPYLVQLFHWRGEESMQSAPTLFMGADSGIGAIRQGLKIILDDSIPYSHQDVEPLVEGYRNWRGSFLTNIAAYVSRTKKDKDQTCDPQVVKTVAHAIEKILGGDFPRKSKQRAVGDSNLLVYRSPWFSDILNECHAVLQRDASVVGCRWKNGRLAASKYSIDYMHCMGPGESVSGVLKTSYLRLKAA